MGINTNNDWDPLEEIVVGTADNARVPTLDLSTRSFSYANYDLTLIEGLEGPTKQWIIDEANEDLDGFSKVLESLGVKVRRPKSIDHSKKFSSPDWKTTGWYTYCPRDLLLPLSNLVIECPSPMRARQYETLAYRDVLYDALEDGTEWISAPRPRLLDDNYQFYNLKEPTLLNKEIIFDAPNIVRMGRDLLYQVSNSGNLLGFKWLKTILEPRGYRLHLSEGLYSYAHFDSTIIPLRPGLVLFNADRVKKDNYPTIFKNWDKIFFEGVVDIGTNLPNGVSPCSSAIGLNFLSINENLIICDENQEALRTELSQYNIESIGLPLRQARTLSGGFHCVTLDTKRKGELEDYFA